MVLISLRWCYFDPIFDRSILDESETLCSIMYSKEILVQCHILPSIPIALLSLHFNELIWRFQSRCSSKITPRYLTLLQVLIFCPLILKFRCFVICFCLGLKIIISVLLVSRLILFARSHIDRLKEDLDLFINFFIISR